MNFFCAIFLLCCFLIFSTNCVLSHDRRQRVIPDPIYNALVEIVDGVSLPPVKERTTAQKSTLVRYWRFKGEFTTTEENGVKVLHYKHRRLLLRESEISGVVAQEFDKSKRSGAAKIASALKDNFGGLKKRVQAALNNDKLHYKRNAMFCNKATLKPIRASDVQIKHQVDLMDVVTEEL